MTFKEGYRLEKVYFENIYTLLNMLKSVDKNNVDMNTVKELLDNAIADNESIILIYKNLGELYSEVADNYSKLLADLEALKENLESWKDEINEKIDDLNNYIMSLIRDIEQRLDNLEQRMSDAEEAIDSLENRMDTAEGDIDALEGRMDTAEDDIDSLEGRMNTAEDDIDNLETNKQDKLTAGNGIVIDSNNEISVDNTVVQPKLTEGFGIDIDSNNEIKVDTAQVQEKLIAGQNITLTPDTTDPTKTVIDASGGGASYSAGSGIDINNNVISNSRFPYETKVALAITNDTTKQTGSIAEYYGITWKYSTGNPVPIFTGLDKTKVVHGRLYINLLMEQAQTVKDNVHSLPLNSVNVEVSGIIVSLTYTDENNTEITKSIVVPNFTAVVSCIDFGGTTGKVFRGAPNPYQIVVPLDGLHDYSVRVSFNVKMNSLGEKSGGGTFQQEFANIYNNIFGVNVYFFVDGESGLVVQ